MILNWELWESLIQPNNSIKLTEIEINNYNEDIFIVTVEKEFDCYAYNNTPECMKMINEWTNDNSYDEDSNDEDYYIEDSNEWIMFK